MKLEDIMSRPQWDDLDIDFELKIKILIARIKEKRVFKVLGLFSLSRPVFMTTISTILTYIVVLLQLKTVEIPLMN